MKLKEVVQKVMKNHSLKKGNLKQIAICLDYEIPDQVEDDKLINLSSI